MKLQKVVNPQFEIKVKVSYVEHESKPEEGYHLFSYRIFIKNNSSFTAQLNSRHWIITDNAGKTEEVRGAGVVGQQPRITPKETFEYESVCPLNCSSGSMRGYYQMISDTGESFDIEIPEFYLVAPTSLH